MNKCNRCGVEIIDETNVCPLCKSVIEGDGTGVKRYPDIFVKTRKLNLLLRIYLGVVLISEMALITVNYLLDNKQEIGLLIAGIALIYVYIMLRVLISKSMGIRSRTIGFTTFSVIYIILIDISLGYTGWSFNYVLPISLLFLTIADLIFMITDRKHWQKYIVSQIGIINANIVLVILALVGIITNTIFVLISAFASIGLFLLTVIIGGRKAKQELRRRFHISR